jgi:hypothetical protein
VYFTSKALQGAEEWYPRIEKLVLALVFSARRLRPYFQAHSIKVLTEHLLKKILQRPNISGRMVNWAIKIGDSILISSREWQSRGKHWPTSLQSSVVSSNFPKGKGGVQVSGSGSGLFHQMGRNRGSSQDNTRECLKLLMEVGIMSARHPTCLCDR